MPVPLLVMLFKVVGAVDVFQQTPFCVISAPPSEEIDPPEKAVVCVINEILFVIRVGRYALVVNEISFPYAMPIEFIA